VRNGIVEAIIVGAGHRSLLFASYSKAHPDELRIVGVADPIELRRRHVAELYGLSPDRCFESAEQLAQMPKMADAVINGTMDHQHVKTSLPLLAAGYDILLEKPFATHEEEMWALVDACREHDQKIMICHILRYDPFYTEVRKRVAAGQVGEIINIQTAEHVSYHHMAVSHVRGKWGRKDRCHSSMLLAKCCHDLDLIAWMMSGVAPLAVSSHGCNMQFRPEKAPEGAGTRCMVDCPIEADCLYSARKHYIDHPDRWEFYVWASIEDIPSPTLDDKIESLKTDNPFGRCVWRCDNDVVDHQSVAIEFENGATATHNMVGGASRPMRTIHIIGTRGEIQGIMEDGRFVVRNIDPRPGHEYSEEWVETDSDGPNDHGECGEHGCADAETMADFVRLIRGEPRAISSTSLDDSVNGHLMVFCADRAMEERRVVEVPRRRAAGQGETAMSLAYSQGAF